MARSIWLTDNNYDISDLEIGKLEQNHGDFPVPEAGEDTKTFLGKVRKFITDFNSFKDGVITLGKLANNLQTTQDGFALDARAGKSLYDMYSKLNSDITGLNTNKASKEELTNKTSTTDFSVNPANNSLVRYSNNKRYYSGLKILNTKITIPTNNIGWIWIGTIQSGYTPIQTIEGVTCTGDDADDTYIRFIIYQNGVIHVKPLKNMKDHTLNLYLPYF